MSHGWSRPSTSTARESVGEFGGSGMSGGCGMHAAVTATSATATRINRKMCGSRTRERMCTLSPRRRRSVPSPAERGFPVPGITAPGEKGLTRAATLATDGSISVLHTGGRDPRKRHLLLVADGTPHRVPQCAPCPSGGHAATPRLAAVGPTREQAGVAGRVGWEQSEAQAGRRRRHPVRGTAARGLAVRDEPVDTRLRPIADELHRDDVAHSSKDTACAGEGPARRCRSREGDSNS